MEEERRANASQMKHFCFRFVLAHIKSKRIGMNECTEQLSIGIII